MCCIRDVGRNVGTYVETSITMTRAGVMTLSGFVPNTRSHVCGGAGAGQLIGGRRGEEQEDNLNCLRPELSDNFQLGHNTITRRKQEAM